MSQRLSSWWSKFLAVVLAAAMLSAGCAETARITTVPEGGKVKINGMYIGDTPTTYRYRAGLPETWFVEVDKPGYKEVRNLTIDRTLRADVSLLLLIAAIVPYFFSARLEDQYVFQLEPLPGTVPPAPAPTAPPPATAAGGAPPAGNPLGN